MTDTPWKPISQYPITPDRTGARGPVVLARNAEKTPFVVVMNRGQFFCCPGVPYYFGDRTVGFMTCSDLTEFMEIPA